MSQTRTIVPDINMDPASYDVTGNGPEGATFAFNTTDETTVVEDLAFGDWTVGVFAKNADGDIIASGEGTGGIQINIDTDMQNPIDTTIAGALLEVAIDGSMIVTASGSGAFGTLPYKWCVNGNEEEVGDTYVITGEDFGGTGAGDFPLGVYRLDVTSYNADGTQAGSSTWNFHVVEEIAIVCGGSYEGNYTISDQTSLDAFDGYSGLTGTLTIDSDTLTSLEGLECLVTSYSW